MRIKRFNRLLKNLQYWEKKNLEIRVWFIDGQTYIDDTPKKQIARINKQLKRDVE